MKSIVGITAASILLVASQTAFAQAGPRGQTQPPPGAGGAGTLPMPGPMGQPGSGMPPGPGAKPMPGPTGQPVSGMTMNPAMMQEHMKRMEEHAANMEALLRQLVELQQKK